MSDEKGAKSADPIILEAQRRFKYCNDWESDARKHFKEDLKFANGDSSNNYQWPSDVFDSRNGTPGHPQPTLTINKVRQHNLQIVNDAKKNKPGIKFSPVGNSATKESAFVLNGLARHIEQQSNAPAHYDNATKFMVDAGWGYVRVKTDFIDKKSFNQEIYVRPVQNPLNVYLDPTTVEPDQIDAKYGFVVEDLDRDSVRVKYPRYADAVSQEPFDGVDVGWFNENTIRVAEYYRLRSTADTLWMYIPDGKAEPVYILESMLGEELRERVTKNEFAKSRPVVHEQLEWFFIIGNKIVDQQLKMPGKYIPLVKFSGEATIIDGKYDCRGHTRMLMEPQRMYNYWASGAIEYGALQTKTPFFVAAESIEDYENDYNEANIVNKSVLMYKALADDGVRVIPPPTRIPPPVSAPLALDGMRIADEQMMSASGQYQAMLGMPGNERSAKAIQERQRQGDTATYHYIDAVALGVRKVGKIVLDLIPTIYDSIRTVQILNEDGKTQEISVDPLAKAVYEERQAEVQGGIERVFNPKLGEYEVVVDIGPSFATKREDSFNAFMQLLGQAPQFIPIIGDILLRMADFPMSEEAADRLRRLVPPHALGVGPSPTEQQQQQQIQNLSQLLQKLMEENAKNRIGLKDREQQKVIDMFNAVTARLKVIAEDKQIQLDTASVKQLVAETMSEVFGTPLDLVANTAQGQLGQAPAQGALPLGGNQPPQPGARMGADGGWYARNYGNSEQFRRLT